MGGFFGGETGLEKSTIGNLSNVFNYGMGAGQNAQTAGMGLLAQANNAYTAPADYFKSLLSGGRSTTAMQAAPTINAALSAQDTARRQAAAQGTARTGGTAAAQAESGQQTQAQLNNLINQALMQGRQVGAQGMQSIGAGQAGLGGTALSQAASLLGLGTGAEQGILGAAQNIAQRQQQALTGLGAGLGGLLTAPLNAKNATALGTIFGL